MGLMKDLDLDEAGEFLVMAATLMVIKSKMLLPSEEIDFAEEIDPRYELVQQLLEYKRLKDSGKILVDQAHTAALRVGRPDSARPEPLKQEDKALDDLGAETIFWRVAMKPGKPLVFCIIDGGPYFGLPGNPVSSMMSFLQFVRPAIRKASGYSQAAWPLPEARAQIAHSVHNDGNRRQYMRATLSYRDGQLHARTAKSQGSHMISSMLGANGFVVLEPNQQVAKGGEVAVQIVDRIF